MWKWNMEHVTQRMLVLTNNDIELMVRKIERLSGECQRVLKLAAAIGNKFSVSILAIVMGEFRYFDFWPLSIFFFFFLVFCSSFSRLIKI